METQNPEAFSIHTKDDINLEALKYSPQGDCDAGLIIVHGMAEHQQRYQTFAQYMLDKHYTVYTYDQRGHGKTAGTPDNTGFFAHENGHKKVVNDLLLLVQIVKKELGEKPIFLMGHSMGSFVSRNFAAEHSELIDGLILSGTAADKGLLGTIGIGLAKIISWIRGEKHPSKLMDTLSFGEFNKAFKPNRTKFDWLSRDESKVDEYINDPFCGSIFSASFFADMLKLIKKANNPDKVAQIKNNLPLLLVSGKNDPVGDFGKGVQKVYDIYKKAGLLNITLKLYPDGRHEMLNETNRDEVFEDILSWTEKQLRQN